MTYLELLAPESIVVLGGCLAFLLGVSRVAALRAGVAAFAVFVLLAAAGASYLTQTSDIGTMASGVLITPVTHYVRWITLIVGILIVLTNWHLPIESERGEFFGLILLSLAGVMLTAAADDLVVLFLAIELVSIPTYVLVALSRTDVRASEAAVKYFFLGALSAAIMVYGFSFLYGAAGTTVLQSSASASISFHLFLLGALPPYTIIGLVLAIAGLSFKVAAVPFHAYAPDVYEGAASPITGLLGFLPKLAGFIAIMKLLSTCQWQLPTALLWVLWITAAATMTVGNVLALMQQNVKRILAYSSISHTGYMFIGLLVGPRMGAGPMHDGLAALLFYIVVYGVMNLGAFAVLAGLRVRGEAAESLDDLAGLAKRAPWSALALAVCVFSLMGFPPTAGMLGKVYLFSSGLSLTADHPFQQELVVLVVIAVINSAIGAVYYLRIAGACYMRQPEFATDTNGGFMLKLAAGVCSTAMLVVFIFPNQVVRRAQIAARNTAYLTPMDAEPAEPLEPFSIEIIPPEP